MKHSNSTIVRQYRKLSFQSYDIAIKFQHQPRSKERCRLLYLNKLSWRRCLKSALSFYISQNPEFAKVEVPNKPDCLYLYLLILQNSK